MNGDETDVDCGGPSCDRCGIGELCLSSDDCAGSVCSNGEEGAESGSSTRRLGSNGAGSTFQCSYGSDNSNIARAACDSVYGAGTCTTGSCGSFFYWYYSGHVSCDCNKPVGAYEFIYENTGYTTVGADYGGGNADVTNNQLFVRVTQSGACDTNSWGLALANLVCSDNSGGACADNGAGNVFECGTASSNDDIARAACESFYGAGQCTTGACGSFSYWYYVGHTSCDSGKSTGYEWIYSNTGYTTVGADYGCGAESVSGNQLFVRYRSNACWTLKGTNLACTETTCKGGLNGAGSLFQCTGSPSNSDIARAACESFYGAGQCTTGTCGYFSYWYHIYHPTCGGKTTGYEWIYSNTGYANVGEDYGCGAESVSGNQLFVRYYSSNCWTLALGDLQCPGMCTGNADPYAEEAPTLLPL